MSSQETTKLAILDTQAPRAYSPYRISVEQYTTFRERGFLVVKGLVPPQDVQELNAHMDDMRAGRVSGDDSVNIHSLGVKANERRTVVRLHMLHRVSAIHERFL